jgi:hypothetical protein
MEIIKENLELLNNIRKNGGTYEEVFENYTREYWEEFVGNGVIIWERHFCREAGCIATEPEELCFINNCYLSGSVAATLTEEGQ